MMSEQLPIQERYDYMELRFALGRFRNLLWELDCSGITTDQIQIMSLVRQLGKAVIEYKKYVVDSSLLQSDIPPYITLFIEKVESYCNSYRVSGRDTRIVHSSDDLYMIVNTYTDILKVLYSDGVKGIYDRYVELSGYETPSAEQIDWRLCQSLVLSLSDMERSVSDYKKGSKDTPRKVLSKTVSNYEKLSAQNPTIYIPHEIVDEVFKIRYYLEISEVNTTAQQAAEFYRDVIAWYHQISERLSNVMKLT